MKRFIGIVLIIPFVSGIPGCKPCEEVAPFFEIQQMTAMAKIADSQSHLVPANNNDTVDFDEYIISCLFDVNYHTEVTFPLPFETTSAFARKCADKGGSGSKEGLDTVLIITKGDYNITLKANDTINSIVKIDDGIFGSSMSVGKYVEANKTVVRNKLGAGIRLTAKPTQLALPHSFVVVYKLGNGEVYSDTTVQVFFK